jgi:hypothetical protein
MTKQKIAGEGVHLRREILLNAIIPMALALAEEETRIALFAWFWSTPALHSYGVLKRKFPNLPQEFLWQQQGMLEYMREHGRKSTDVGLESVGLNPSANVYWNLSTPELYEIIARRSEGNISAHGALITDTGEHTGRAA